MAAFAPLHALVTGASDGIGQATAAGLATAGLCVLVHGRNQQRAEQAAAKIAALGPAPIAVWGDLAKMTDVVALAQQVTQAAPQLDILINNAGMYASAYEITADGFERTMAVNYFAPWLLTMRLLPALRASARGRVINVSSMTHDGAALKPDNLEMTRSWSAYGAYACSKLGNLLFNQVLAAREPGLSVNALHPGVIGTKLLRAGFSIDGGSATDGARTPLWLATAADVARKSGAYFVNCRETQPGRKARDSKLATALWEITERRLHAYLVPEDA